VEVKAGSALLLIQNRSKFARVCRTFEFSLTLAEVMAGSVRL
jgi:hypothetical protein